jgi:UDP-glucuronate 4-epimerase
MLEGRPIQVFNHGRMERDFTYIDDAVDGVIRVLDKPAVPDPDFDPANPDPATSWAPHRLFNIGNARPTLLMEYIEAIESALGIAAIKEFLPMQPGDVPVTSADTSALEAWINFRPSTPVREGVARFVVWYRWFYGV